ncbi:MAG: hypothetical protein ACI9LM_000721 [Alteromonadaceae bacterium]|jgi:hypothetical protein
MFLINEPLIKSVNLTNENVVMIVWEAYWYQEDVDELMTKVFQALGEVNIIENMQGADRTNIRFNYKTRHFSLNFECYSQSCWVEPEDELSAVLNTEIAQSIMLLL